MEVLETTLRACIPGNAITFSKHAVNLLLMCPVGFGSHCRWRPARCVAIPVVHLALSKAPEQCLASLKSCFCLAVDQRVFLAMQPVCRFGLAAPSCIIGLRNEICIYLEVGVSIGYFVATCYLYAWKLRQHKRFPLRVVQVGMLFFRLQVSLWVVSVWLLVLHTWRPVVLACPS